MTRKWALVAAVMIGWLPPGPVSVSLLVMSTTGFAAPVILIWPYTPPDEMVAWPPGALIERFAAPAGSAANIAQERSRLIL